MAASSSLSLACSSPLQTLLPKSLALHENAPHELAARNGSGLPSTWLAVTPLGEEGGQTKTRAWRFLAEKQKFLKGSSCICEASVAVVCGRQRLRQERNRLDALGSEVEFDTLKYASLLRWCGNAKSLADGKWVHARIIGSGRDGEAFLGNLLVQMYGKCGSVEDARAVFDRISERNLFSWNLMISVYAQNRHGKQALRLFGQMQAEGFSPDKFTVTSLLSACAKLGALADGKLIHALGVANGLESNLIVGNALVHMYGGCGSLRDARGVFQKLHPRNVISWTSMIAAYAQNGCCKEALQLYRQMSVNGVKPNEITVLAILATCGILACLALGKLFHAMVVGSALQTHAVETALINMYGKCGSLIDARNIFDKMHQRNVPSWNAMIATYAQNGHGDEALALFEQMELEGLLPNKITFLHILDSCAGLASIAKGRAIHARIVASAFKVDNVVENSLINMYGKCGSLKDACHVFDKIPKPNVVSWTAMIAAYAYNGRAKLAIELFRQLEFEGVIPNEITFLHILTACSHAGLVDEGRHFFTSMSGHYSIRPTLEHYGCMVDLLGRAGLLDEAEDMINNMPAQPNAIIWMALLGACQIHCDVERGERAAEHAFFLDPENAAPYVSLSNIYAAAGRWDDASNVRKLMEDRRVKKQPGCSWIEVNDKLHGFTVGDTSHPQFKEIYSELHYLNRQMEEAGYVPEMKIVSQDTEEKKEQTLCYHSEMLAIAFGLIATPCGTPLSIVKNLRVCSDCHVSIKFISSILQREIIVRDAKRFHHFKHGMCSCGDYW